MQSCIKPCMYMYESMKEWLFLFMQSQVGVEDEGKPVTDHLPDEGKPPSDYGDPLPDDAFLMVTQLPWENNVIYDMPSIGGTPRTAQGLYTCIIRDEQTIDTHQLLQERDNIKRMTQESLK